MKHLLVLLLFTSLSACVSNANRITTDVDTLTRDNMGYALIGLKSKKGFNSLLLNGESYVRLSTKDINVSSSFILIPLNAGDYNFYRLETHWWYNEFNTDDAYWQFSIKPGTISYVGHLSIENSQQFGGRKASLVNRSSEALEFMEEKFPNILESRTMAYGGPGEDDFFEFAAQLPDVRQTSTPPKDTTTQGSSND